MNKEVNGYYQSNIKTSRNEDSVYAMKYASQQMLIDKLEKELEQLKQIEKEHQKINGELREEMKELRSWLEDYFKGLTIKEIGIDDFYRKGMFRMKEYTLDKLNELEGKDENNT